MIFQRNFFFNSRVHSPCCSRARRGCAQRGCARRGCVRRGRGRRRGVSTYLFVLAFPMMIGILGIVIDLGNLYTKRAQAQRAADAAAIAGAMEGSKGDITGKAREYATRNSYTDGVGGATVRVYPELDAKLSQVRVIVSRREPVYFAPILEGFLKATGKSTEAAQFSRTVSAEATAQIRVKLPLGLGGIYGVADPARSPTNNSLFGPYANYNFGDAYSTRFLQDGVTPNPLYNQTNGIGEYSMNITTAYLNKYAGQNVALEIYDPDCTDGANGYDEIRAPNSKIKPAPSGGNTTVTVYEIYDPDGTLIATSTYGADTAADGKWVTPNGFSFKPTKVGKYSIKVRTTSGSSENGFQLRAGPADGVGKTDAQWNKDYGDNNGTNQQNVAIPIDAEDHLQLNFTRNGTVKFRLGYVPDTQAGKTISVNKFDVDVGSTNITYTCDALPGQTFAGKLPQPGDGVWSTDDIAVPPGYTGGNWFAQYSAASGDSSTWTLTGTGDGERQVRLVK